MSAFPEKSWRTKNAIKKQKKRLALEKKLEEQLKSISGDVENNTEQEISKLENLKTVTIAVAGSILNTAQGLELKSYLAGQIARAACIFSIDEVVIFNDLGDTPPDGVVFNEKKHNGWRSCVKLGRLLQYLECPQYLRKYLFPVHKDLQYAGLLNPLDIPHHLRVNDEFQFREGVVVDKPRKSGKGSYAYIGLEKPVALDKVLTPGIRVTVKLLPKKEGTKKLKGLAVPPVLPKSELGVYWGYDVRLAKSLTHVFSECPYDNDYDLVIGTSDKGVGVNDVEFPQNFKHCIIIFGGVHGLEEALENDETSNVDEVSKLFNYYVNTCPKQAVRTIRTEEAVLITLANLTNKIQK